MKHLNKGPAYRALAAAVLSFCLSACVSMEDRRAAEQPRTLIRNVTVIPMEAPGAVRGRDVVIEGERIVAIARTGRIRRRSADQVIEGTGKYLMPGLWDMHTHVMSRDAAATVTRTLPLYLSYGVVGVRDTGSTLEDLTMVRAELRSAPGLPSLVATGPLLDGPKQPWQQRVALALDTVEEARRAAVMLADAHVDAFKIYNNVSPEQFAAVAAISRERGIPMIGHVPFDMTVDQITSGGQKGIEHAGFALVADCIPEGRKATSAILQAWIKSGFSGKYEETIRWWSRRDVAACRALYSRLAQRGTWVTPNLANEIKGGEWTTADDLAVLPERYRVGCEKSLVSINSKPALRDAADALVFAQIRELHAAGVPLLAGSDAPNECLWYGRGLHEDLQLLERAGLSRWEVLRTATANPARFLGRLDEGVIRKGAVANLLLLDADPLAKISNTLRIGGVMLRGAWRDGPALARMRTMQASPAAAAPSH